MEHVTKVLVKCAPLEADFSYELLSKFNDPNYMTWNRETGVIAINADNGYFEYEIDQWSGDGRTARATRTWPTPDPD